MTDQLERDLADLFAVHAGGTDPAPLPLADITASGRELAHHTRVRRGAFAAIAAAAAVVAVAVPVGLHGADRGSAPAPVGPSAPTTTPTAAPSTTAGTRHATTPAQRTIAHGEPYDFVVGADGQLATLWSTCDDRTGVRGCRVAWQLHSGDRTWSGLAHQGDQIVAGGAGFIVSGFAHPGGFVINPDGTTTRLRPVRPMPFTPGDAVVPYRDLLVDAKTATSGPLAAEPGHSLSGLVNGVLVDGETIWAEQRQGGSLELAWRTDNGVWQTHPMLVGGPALFGPVAARGRLVAAVSATISTDSNPTTGLSVSHDGGSTWSDLPGSALPFVEVDELAITGDGALYIKTQDELYRSTNANWTTFAKVATPGLLSDIQTMPDGTLAAITWAKGRPTAVVTLEPRGDTVVVDKTLLAAHPAHDAK